MRRRWVILFAVASVLALVLAACGDDDGDGGADGASGSTIRVPDDHATIQEAVDAAEEGDLVLVAAGTYHEAVKVTTPNIVVRGESRSGTVLDGEFQRDNGFRVEADGVAIENLTAQNYELNGFLWTDVTGYRGSYLNAVRNGDYGIYAFNSTKGQFDHDYASGSPDAGFYIGQCYPCDAIITDSEAEWNGLGYSGTNAGGNLLIVNSWFHDNRAGIVPNSGTGELNPPERETTIVGNVVTSNNNGGTPAIEIAEIALGNGILLAGGVDNIVERNLVEDHDIAGIAPIPLPEELLDPDDPASENFDAEGNRVVGNVVRDSREFDLGLVATIDNDDDALGNCFADNEYTTSMPADIEAVAPCDGTPQGQFKTDLGRFASLLGAVKPQGADYQTVQLPPVPALDDMPDAANAPARPATDVPTSVDLAAIGVPSGPPRPTG